MIVAADEREPIAALLEFLEAGERLAHDCAARQARLMAQRGSACDVRTLFRQSRQEYGHAVIFSGARRWLGTRHRTPSRLLPAFEAYRRRIDDALQRQDVTESLLAEQIILEGLGHAILSRMELGLAKRRAPLSRLRRILIAQEAQHQAFGLDGLKRAMASGETSQPALCAMAEEYLALTDTMVLSLADLFSDIHEDAAAWAADARRAVPEWLR